MVYEPRKDLYATLGVAPLATIETIKTAYRTKITQVHPDRHGDDPAATHRAQAVNDAYAVLSNPAARREYDTLRTAYWRSVYAPVAAARRAPATTARVASAPPPIRTAPTAATGTWAQMYRDMALRFAHQRGASAPFATIGSALASRIAEKDPFWAFVTALGGAALDDYLNRQSAHGRRGRSPSRRRR